MMKGDGVKFLLLSWLLKARAAAASMAPVNLAHVCLYRQPHHPQPPYASPCPALATHHSHAPPPLPLRRSTRHLSAQLTRWPSTCRQPPSCTRSRTSAFTGGCVSFVRLIFTHCIHGAVVARALTRVQGTFASESICVVVGPLSSGLAYAASGHLRIQTGTHPFPFACLR